MKKLSKNVLLVFVGIVISFVTNVAAEAVISSGAVSYGNTTVNAALDELFSAVDINNKIGTTDISSIGNGTITGAISELNGDLEWNQANITWDSSIGGFYVYNTYGVYYKIDGTWLDIRIIGTYVTNTDIDYNDIMFTISLPVDVSSESLSYVVNATDKSVVPIKLMTDGTVHVYDTHTIGSSNWLAMTSLTFRLLISK